MKHQTTAHLTRWATAVKSFILMIVCKEQQKNHAERFLIATEGSSFERSLSDFRATSAGRDLLQRRPNSWGLFGDRSALQACPPGSLGRHYAEFVTTHGLDENYYLGMVLETGARFAGDAERVWFRTRVDCSHDMRHVLAGYGPDVLGEVCLLSFRFGQIRHAGALALSLLGVLQLTLTSRGPVLGPVIEAYRRGCRARLLDLLPWEDGLAQQLSANRAALGLTPPRRYPSPFAAEAYVNLEMAAGQDAPSHAGIIGGSV
jgi:ubiquinone biosynthesis protein COQ4